MSLSRFHACAPSWMVIATGLALAGCGGGSELKLNPIRGKATFAGKPIVYGLIEFVPDADKKHKAPAGSAEIVDGVYDTRKGGSGVVPGPYKVRITAYEQRPAPASNDETQPSTPPTVLFAGYTLDKDLAGGTEDFDVPESAKGFDLLGGKPKPRSANEP